MYGIGVARTQSATSLRLDSWVLGAEIKQAIDLSNTKYWLQFAPLTFPCSSDCTKLVSFLSETEEVAWGDHAC